MTFSLGSDCRILPCSLVFFGLLVTGQVVSAQTFVQTNWEGGPQSGEIVQAWNYGFESSSGIAWLAVPGQIVLGGIPLNSATMTFLDEGFVGPASLYPSDIDGDGDLDVLGAAVEDGEIAWWRNAGGASWERQTIDADLAGAITIHGRDMDGDSDIDVLAGAHEHGEVAWWENLSGDGTTWTQHPIADDFLTVHWVDAVDVDGDGDDDVLGASIDLGQVALWINDPQADEPWSKQVIDDDFGGARVVTPGDLDGDGDPDLVGVALIDHEISWWRNGGGNPIDWQKTVINDNFRGAHGVFLADLDLDGDLDIIGAGFQAIAPAWWRNDGGDPIVWTELSLGGFFPGALNPTVGDIDGDNDLDVLVTSNSFHQVGWWRNDGGDPFEWSMTTVVENFRNAWPVITADLDGNGILEVVSGASGGTEVAAWELCNFVESGMLTSHVLEIPSGVPHMLGTIDAVVPAGSRADLEVRCGSDSGQIGPWHLVEPGWSIPYAIAGPAYCQYRVHLVSDTPEISPIISSIRLSVIDDPVSPAPREGQGRQGP